MWLFNLTISFNQLTHFTGFFRCICETCSESKKKQYFLQSMFILQAYNNNGNNQHLHLQQQSDSSQRPLGRLVLGLQVESPHVSGSTGSCFVNWTFIHVAKILFILSYGLVTRKKLKRRTCAHYVFFFRKNNIWFMSQSSLFQNQSSIRLI